MKRFTTILTLLLMICMGAWADVNGEVRLDPITSISQINPNKCYTISTVDRGSWFVANSGTQVTSTTKANIAVDASDLKQQFAFINYNNKWFLYSVSERKFISKRGNYTILSSVPNDDVTLLSSSGNESYPVVVAFQDGAYQAGISNGYTPAVITHYNDLTDAGNRALISEAGDFDPTTAQAAITTYLAEPSVTSGHYYRLWNQGDGGSYIKQSALTNTITQAESVILQLIESGNTTPVGKKIYSLYDAETSKYLSYTGVSKSDGNNSNRFAWTDNADNSKFVFNTATGTNNIIIRPAYVADDNYVRPYSSSAGSNLVLWTAANKGIDKWNLTDVTANVVDVTYKTVCAATDRHNVSVKTIIGKNTTMPASLAATIPAYCTYELDKTTTSEANEVITATVTWNGPMDITSDATAPVYYNLNIRSKYLMYDDDATDDVTLNETSTPFNPDASWAFIGNPYDGFKIINKTKGKDYYLTYTNVVTGNNRGNHNIQFENGDVAAEKTWLIDQNNGGFCLRMKENTNIYFHHNNDGGNSFLRTCSVQEWSAVHNDEGSTLTSISDDEALYSLYDGLKNCFFGDGLGNYQYTGSKFADGGVANANIISAGQAIDYEATSLYPDLYETLLDIKNNMTLNLPAEGFYRINGKTSGKYLAAGSVSEGGKFNMSEATDATTIFYFADSKLTNFKSGLCNGMTASSWQWTIGDEASTVVFGDGSTQGGYFIKSATAYFYDGGTSTDRGSTLDSNERYRSWQLTEVTSLPVTISAAGYATLYAPVALTIPSGVTAYTGVIKGEWLSLQPLSSVIPANTGVVLKGSAGTYNFDITTSSDVAEGNALTGTSAAKAYTEGDLVLGLNGSGEIGFYALSGTSYLAGFKAYLPASVGARGLRITFDDSETTGIESVDAHESRANGSAIYNLSGQRVEKPAKGLYIVNGKKVVIK